MRERTDDIGADLRARLSAVRRQIRLTELGSGFILVCLVVLGATLAALGVEGAFHFGPPVRTVIFWALTGTAGVAGARFVLLPLLKMAGILPSEPDAALATLVGEKFPEIRDRLLNGLQLLTGKDRTADYYSPDLRDAALRDLEADCTGIDFGAAVPPEAPRRLGTILGGLAVGTGLLLILFPGVFLGAALRLWQYDRAFVPPPSLTLIVSPGDAEVVKGSDVRLVVRIQGEQQSRPRHLPGSR